uniref:Ionotropic glutamate receptor C-terminal domain-containing protein n=1 Tax=Stomoxys calcitrans TaxID=35570 RepID=A0A1I8Q8F0_STOCA
MALDSAIALLILSSNITRIHKEQLPQPKMVNNSFVIEIVSSVHELYHFKNFVFYISERLAKDTEISNDFFHDFWETFPTVPSILMINNNQSMDGFLSTPSLCLVLTTGFDDPIMKLASVGMRGVRFLKTIFIYFPILSSKEYYHSLKDYKRLYEGIRRLYAWIWRKQFINCLLMTVDNNIFIHEPYPTLQIINVTSQWNSSTFFMDYSTDFKGYVIDSPVRYDLPRVFFMTGPRYGLGKKKPHVSGVSGKLFMIFVDYIKANYNESKFDGYEYEALDLAEIINKIDQKELEISMNSYTGILGSNIGSSYPIGINDWCIMVPYRNETPAHMYLQKSFRPYTWYLMCFSVFYIALGLWLSTPPSRRDISLSLLQAICSMVLISPLRIFKVPSTRIRFLFVLLFIMGFFITNLYLTKMASFLTASPEVPQINTVQDVIDAKLPIMIANYEYDIMMSNNFPAEFMALMVPVSKGEMDKHRDKFNNSFGYSIQSDRWDFLSIQQRFMKKPMFRLSEICMGPFYHVYPIQKDSHLAKPLQEFIMSAFQFGLVSYWNAEAFADALYLDYVTIIVEEDNFVPLSLTFFRSIWIVWWFGLLFSGLAFCLEIKWHLLQRKRNNLENLYRHSRTFKWLKIKN